MGKFFSCFKAYDIRGEVPSALNEDLAYRIGRAYADRTGAKRVCLGYDSRLSGPSLAAALSRGFHDAGVDTVNLGTIGTEMVYFSTAHFDYDGGIMITASHNPPKDNGMKMVTTQSRPISGDTGLLDIEERAYHQKWERNGKGSEEKRDVYPQYVDHILGQIDVSKIKPFKILANAGNGAAGLAMEKIASRLPIEVTEVLFQPDGTFPNGVPNPILPECRATTLNAFEQGKHDFSVAWDGDYDRCFFFDENGRFIEGYYIVGVLAKSILQNCPGGSIIYDPRLTWNTLDVVSESGGNAVICKSGHAFIKEKMREVDAVYGGEMSAHHYFKSNWYCDSGMIPLMLVLQLLSNTGSTLGEQVEEMMKKYPCSGEINSKVDDVSATIEKVASKYSDGKMERVDGLSIEYPEWRFNLRGSNTEPVIRLNVESRGNKQLMEDKTSELLNLIREERCCEV